MANEDSVEEPTKTEEKQDPRDSVDYWIRWIAAAKKSAKRHWERSSAAWKEYEAGAASLNKEGEPEEKDELPNYPIYFSSVDTIEPAFYARTPKLLGKRRFDIDDENARMMGLIERRLGEYHVDGCDYDAAMSYAVSDFVHASKTTLQVIYDHKTVKDTQRMALSMQMGETGAPSYMDEMGTPYDGEVFQDETGYFYNSETSRVEDQKIYVAALPYDEILHTPDAKSDAEIKDKAYYFCLSYEEAMARFPEIEPTRLPWKTGKNYDDRENDTDNPDAPGKYIEGWEIWCKYNKQVYWVCPEYKEGFLDKKPDPYGLTGFFPSPKFALATKSRKSLYPIPVFTRLKSTVDALHMMYGRIFSLIESVKRKAIVDGAEESVISALNDLNGQEFVGVQNYQNIIEKGGLQNLIQYVPVKELVEAIAELTQLEERFKNSFNEWFGTPDVIRGVSEPMDTASAVQLQSGAAHDRFRYKKKLIMELGRDAIQMMVDLALKVYDDEKIARICGYQYMSQTDQALFLPALTMLRSDEERMIRLEIETDSTSFANEQLDQQNRNIRAQTIVTGLDKIAAMSQNTPEFVPVALRTLLMVLDGLPGSESDEDTVQSGVKALMEKANQPPPEMPPPPDYEAMKLQLQQKELTDAASAKGVELTLKERELAIREREALVKEQAVLDESALKQVQTLLEQQAQNFKEFIETQKLELERYKAQIDSYEKLLEERRLAQAEMEARTAALEPKTMPEMPMLTIVNEAAKPAKKTARITRDANGNANIQIEEVLEP